MRTYARVYTRVSLRGILYILPHTHVRIIYIKLYKRLTTLLTCYANAPGRGCGGGEADGIHGNLTKIRVFSAIFFTVFSTVFSGCDGSASEAACASGQWPK